jgi:hypothetical protein
LTWASSIFRPLERMSGAIDRVECGDLSASHRSDQGSK